MPSLDEVKNVILELISLEDVADHVCFFGGAMPYIVAGEQSGRNHSDIDVLVDEEYMEKIRQIAQEKFHYMPEQDSLAMGMNRDYGFKIFIGGVYVEFEPIAVRDGVFFHRSFSLNSKKAGEQQIPFEDIQDIMVPIEINGIKTHSQSNEMIRLSKSECGRPKDLADIAFIDSCGIGQAKYQRLKEAMAKRTLDMFAYEERVM